jgi:hypothetical protein
VRHGRRYEAGPVIRAGDAAPDRVLKLVLQADQVEQARPRIGRQLDQEIDITVAARLAAGDRSAQAHPPDAARLEPRGGSAPAFLPPPSRGGTPAPPFRLALGRRAR